jgi:hypothetical protein
MKHGHPNTAQPIQARRLAEAVRADAARAAALAEYNARREKAPETADAQWKLALWCARNGLEPEARAHLAAVVRLDPSRKEAWEKLGCKNYKGRWLTPDQIARERAEEAAQHKADTKWLDNLKNWKSRLHAHSKVERARAEDHLAGVSDPRAARAVWAVFALGGEADQSRAVTLFGQIDGPEAALDLAALAVYSLSAPVRGDAAATLVRRDPRDVVGPMIDLVRTPLKFEVRPVYGPGQPGVLFVEGERFNIQRIYPAPLPPNAGDRLDPLPDADDRGPARAPARTVLRVAYQDHKNHNQDRHRDEPHGGAGHESRPAPEPTHREIHVNPPQGIGGMTGHGGLPGTHREIHVNPPPGIGGMTGHGGLPGTMMPPGQRMAPGGTGPSFHNGPMAPAQNVGRGAVFVPGTMPVYGGANRNEVESSRGAEPGTGRPAGGAVTPGERGRGTPYQTGPTPPTLYVPNHPLGTAPPPPDDLESQRIERDQRDRGRSAAIEENWRQARRAAASAGQQLEADLAAVQAYNADAAVINERVVPVLRSITGQDFGQDRQAWSRWWVNEREYVSPEPGPKPTFRQNVPPLVPPNFRVSTSCFAAGTPVRALDGSRPIESLKVGDQILCQDTATGALSFQPVLRVFHNKPAPTLKVDLGAGGAVVATAIHRFWRAGKGWAMARELKPGDVLRTLGGSAAVAGVTAGAVQPVFNLEVAEGHTFFVGGPAVLVHDNSLVPPVPHPFDSPTEVAATPPRPPAPKARRGRAS